MCFSFGLRANFHATDSQSECFCLQVVDIGRSKHAGLKLLLRQRQDHSRCMNQGPMPDL